MVILDDRLFLVRIEPLRKNVIHLAGQSTESLRRQQKAARHRRIESTRPGGGSRAQGFFLEKEVLPTHLQVADMRGLARPMADQVRTRVIKTRERILLLEAQSQGLIISKAGPAAAKG